MRWGSKRVAQATSDPAPASADQPPADGATPPPADAAPPTPAPAPEAAPAATVDTAPSLSDDELAKLAEQEAKEEVITVTGSTIERKTLTTPAPLTILNREDLTASGRSTVGDILQQLPSQSNALNAQINNGGDGSTRVDIRGLGAERTLTLLNGRRIVPSGTGADASVDINTIPLAVIERVEVLKDGASAIYGSDAIGGVVNIITRTDFNGTEAAIYTGGAAAGDGFTYDASFVTGHTSEDKKGNVLFSAGIQEQRSIFAGDRDFAKFDRDFDFDTHEITIGGSPTIPGTSVDATTFDTNGNGKIDKKSAMNPGGDIPVDVCGVGETNCTNSTKMTGGGFRPLTDTDVYNFQPANYLVTPSNRYNVYSSGTYKLTPEISTFFEASYIKRQSAQELAPEPLVLSGALKLSASSIYNPYGFDLYGLRRRLEEFGPRHVNQNNDTFRIVTGFQGAVADDAPAFKNWKWELSYNYGRNDSSQDNHGNLIKSRVGNALGPSMMSAAGKPICVTTPGDEDTAIDGCVPMDVLGPSGSISPEARAYATFTGVQSGFNTQQTVLAQTHGSIAKLPNNGDLSVAVGGDYRREAGGQTPDPLTSTGDTTGNAIQPTNGSYDVFEGFGEVSLVPVSGLKFAEWVELNAAARVFRYDTFGSDFTWKVGGLFRTINGLAVRGTYSTAFRAPAINELFSGKFDNFPSVGDPCDTEGGTMPLEPEARKQCDAQNVAPDANFATRQQREVGGGNDKLKPETAKTITGGVVFEPPQVKGLALTADYWNIDITQAITGLPTATILSNCYVLGLADYCKLINRDANRSYQIDFIDNPQLNVGGTATSGLDLAAGYNHKIGDVGTGRLQAEAQYLFKYNLDNGTTTQHGVGNNDLGALPHWKANLSGGFHSKQGWNAGFNLHWVGTYKECADSDCNNGGTPRDVVNYFKTDLYGGYTFKTVAGTTTFAVGVNNVMDATPPVVYNSAPDSDGTVYDFVGRFVYARISQLF